MKKIVCVALLGAIVALAPVAASAGYKKPVQKREKAHEEVIGVGAGALAGAAIAGPVGAVIGGIAGLLIVKHAD